MNIDQGTGDYSVIQLTGEPLQTFLSFLRDAYPEIVAEPVNGILNISTDSVLFNWAKKVWKSIKDWWNDEPDYTGGYD